MSGLDLASFNQALLASRATVLLVIVDAVFGLEKRDLWARALAGLGASPHIVLAVDTISMADGAQARFEELREQFSNHCLDNTDCGRIHVVPVRFAVGKQGQDVGVWPEWYDGPSLVELLEQLGHGMLARIKIRLYFPLRTSSPFT